MILAKFINLQTFEGNVLHRNKTVLKLAGSPLKLLSWVPHEQWFVDLNDHRKRFAELTNSRFLEIIWWRLTTTSKLASIVNHQKPQNGADIMLFSSKHVVRIPYAQPFTRFNYFCLLKTPVRLSMCGWKKWPQATPEGGEKPRAPNQVFKGTWENILKLWKAKWWDYSKHTWHPW